MQPDPGQKAEQVPLITQSRNGCPTPFCKGKKLTEETNGFKTPHTELNKPDSATEEFHVPF